MVKNLLLIACFSFSFILSDAQTIIASQNFSSGLGNWTSVDKTSSGTVGKWTRRIGAIPSVSLGNLPFKSPTAGNGYALALADVTGGAALNTELTSPAINCSSHAYVGLSFNEWVLLKYTNTVGTVSISTDMNDWTEIHNIQFNYTGGDKNGELIELDISSYAAFQPTVYIRFTYKNTLSEYFWAVDDIKVLALPDHDVAVKSVNTPRFAGYLDQPIKATVQNRGGMPILGMTLGYAVKDTLITEHFSNLGLLPFVSQEFTFSSKLPIKQADVFDISVISYGVLSGMDNNIVNDTARNTIISLTHLPEKKVLLEEFTTARCGYCPGGATRVDRLMKTESDYCIPVSIHAGSVGNDAMTIPEHITLSNAFGSATPAAAIDRILYPEQDEVNIGLPSLFSTYNPWKIYVMERKEVLQPVAIQASNTFNPSNRQLNVTVNATVYGEIKGDYRINCYIVEDSVTGTGTGYNQLSYYNAQPADTSLNPWYKKGNTILNYPHRNVTRHFLGGAWGSSGVIPATTTPGATYTQNYNYTIPSTWNLSRVTLVPFVTRYSSNYSSGINEVMNAIVMNLNDQANTEVTASVYPTGIKETTSLSGVQVYPNPTSDMVNITFQSEKATKLSFEIYNIMGQMVDHAPEAWVPAGTVNTTFNTQRLESGVYMVSIKDSGAPVHSSRFIIER